MEKKKGTSLLTRKNIILYSKVTIKGLPPNPKSKWGVKLKFTSNKKLRCITMAEKSEGQWVNI